MIKSGYFNNENFWEYSYFAGGILQSWNLNSPWSFVYCDLLIWSQQSNRKHKQRLGSLWATAGQPPRSYFRLRMKYIGMVPGAR